MLRTTLLIFCLCISLCAACSRQDDAQLAPDAPAGHVPDLAGAYIVNGIDPLGSEYSGHLTITEGEMAGSYHMQWIITGSIQEGTATLEGNQLNVEWHSLADSAAGEVSGLSTYTITVNGELYGTRTITGHPGEGTETAFPNQ